MRKLIFTLCCLVCVTLTKAQTVITINSGTNVVNSGTSYTISTPYPGPAGSFIDNGSYTDVTSPDGFNIYGDFNISGSGTTTVYNLNINSGATTLNMAVTAHGTVTVGAGDTLNPNSNLYLYSGAYLVDNGYVSGSSIITGIVTNGSTTLGPCPLTTTLSTNVSGSSIMYQWQSSPNNTTWTSIAGATNATYTVTIPASTYFRTILTSNNSSYVQNSQSVLISTVGNPILTTTSSTQCQGSGGMLTVSGATTYQWLPASYLNTTTGSTVIATPPATTIYSVIGTTAGCTSNAIATASVNPLPVATVPPSQTYCNGAMAGAFSFTSSISGTTYTWNNSNTSIGLANSGTGSSIAAFTITNTGAAPSAAVISVIPTSTGCPGTTQTFTLTVNPTPTVTVPANAVYCNGAVTGAFNFTGAVPGTVYSWTNNNTATGLSALGTGDISSFPTSNPGNTPISSIVTVTPSANGCTGTAQSFTITVNPIPVASVTPTSQTECNNTATIPVTFTSSVTGTTYTWTNNNTSIGTGALGTGNLGSFTATNSSTVATMGVFTVVPTANSCMGAGQNFTITVNPTPVATVPANAAVCNGTPTGAFTFGSTVSGTSYTWTNSNTSIGLASTGTGNIASFTATNSSTVAATAVISVTPSASSCPGVAQTFTITVNPTPIGSGGFSQAVCNSAPTAAETFSSSVAGTTYTWNNSNSSIGIASSGTGNIPAFTGTNSGTTPIAGTFTVTPSALTCSGPSQIFTITINPTPTVSAVTNQTVCNGNATATVTFTGAVAGTTYTWMNSNTSIGLASTGSGNIASFTATNTGASTIAGTITVTPTASSCTGTTTNFSIYVNPTPTVTGGFSQTLCSGTLTSTETFGSSVAGATYTWMNNNTGIGLASTGTGSIAAFMATNSGSAAITGTITVTPSASGCSGTASNFSITVNPPPVVTVPASFTVCNGNGTGALTFSSNIAGTTYTWMNNNPTIGLASTGTGNIASFSAANTGTSATNALITVTPTSPSGCAGAAQTFTITVNPTPTVAAISNQTVCNGASTTPVTFTGGISGTTYTWTNTNTSIGLASTGSGNLAAFTATNAGTTATAGTIAVTPTANSCSGPATSFTITVNPTPTVTVPSSPTYCNGVTTAAIIFSGTSAPTYTWMNSNTSIGLASTGTGNIAAFTATNTSSVTATATIVVTPAAATCSGTPQSFTITVNPTPTVAAITSQTVCATASTTAVNFTGVVAGATYTWTNSNINIGLATTGTGNIAAFTATNSGTSPITGAIVVTPAANGCTGATQSFGITVNPIPVVTVPASPTICNGAATGALAFSSTVAGSTYNWTNSNTSIGLGASGSGNIASFTGLNTSASTPNIATITVTPTAGSCAGSSSSSLTITVNPTPTVASITSSTGFQSNCPATSVMETFTSAASATATFTYTSSNTTTGFASGTTSATGIYGPFTTGANATLLPIVSTIVVTPTANGCLGTPTTFAFSVTPTPIMTVTPTSQSVCAGTSTVAEVFTSSIGSTFAWTNSNTSVGLSAATGTGNVGAFSAIDTSTMGLTQSTIISVTPTSSLPAGCIGTTQNITITIKPIPVFTVTPGSQAACSGSATVAEVFTGNVAGTTFNWVNSNTAIGLGATGLGNIASFTAADPSTSAILGTITITPSAAGCAGSTQTIGITVNPTPVMTPVPNQAICNNAAGTINFTSPVTGTTYSWMNSNNTIGLPSSGTGNLSFTAINAGTVAATATLTVTPTSPSGCIGAVSIFTLTVNPTPTVAAIASQTVCNGSATTPVTFAGTVTGTTYNWTNSASSIGLAGAGSGNIASFTGINSGASVITASVIVTPTASTCAGTPQNFTITVNPTPTIAAVANQTLCNGSNTAAIAFTGAVTGTTYNWTNTNASIGLAASGSGSIASFMATNAGATAATGVISVTPMANGCSGSVQTFTITVNPTPAVVTPVNQVLCNSTASTAVTFSGAVAGTVYNWTNSNTAIGLGASGTGNIASFTAANTGIVPISGIVTITPAAAGCTGTVQTFTITVNPTPTVNPTASQTVCNNTATTAVAYTGAVAATTYNWTNSNMAIGLAASGSGNIASFTATNTGITPITGTIIVTPVANSCNGTPRSFGITVNPTPTVTTPANQAICNGAAATPVTFTGAVTTATYSWTNSNAAIGLGASGTGNIPVFTGTNAGAAPISGMITVTPMASGCTGLAQTFTITVNPTPTVTIPANQAVCNGAATAAINYTGAVSGTTYSWTNTNPTIGLGMSGSGNIPSFTATNAGTMATEGMISVVPSANTCIGGSQTFTITVNPTPTVTSVANQTVCNGASTSAVAFTGTVSGTTYAWTNSDASIGLAAAGSGNIASFTGTNSGVTAIDGVIRVVPSANGCAGTADNFTITVNPTPTVATVAGQTVCNGAPTMAINYTGGVAGTAYHWTNSNTAIDLSASGTGNIASFLAMNTGVAPISANITVTPSASGCMGASQSFTITVNPTPTVATPANQTICNAANTMLVSFTGAVGGTTYTWTNSNTAIGLGASGAGNIASFAGTNSGTVAETGTIIVMPAANGCTGSTASFVITVNPTPTVTAPTSQVLCNGMASTAVNFSGAVSGTTYGWTNTLPGIGLGASGTGNIASFTAINAGATPETASVIVIPTASGCIGTSQNFNITVNPTPTVSTPTAQTICNGANTTAVAFTGAVSGTIYNWTNTDTTIGLASSGSGNIASFVGVDSNTTPSIAAISIIPSANGCTGTTEHFTITVDPTPNITVPANQTVCNGSSTAALGFSSLVSGATYTWNNSNPSIGLATSGTGNIAPFIASNSTFAATGAVITVTPSASACSGVSQSFTVTVNPTPNVTVPANQTVCNGSSTDSAAFTSSVPGATFTWANSNTTIGLMLTDTGAVPAFTAINTGTAPASATITVTPSALGCIGAMSSFMITVNPTPAVVAVPNQVVCNNTASSAVDFASPVSGATYTWTNALTSIGLATSGSGNIASFTVVNSGNTPLTSLVTVTATANGCTGTAGSFDFIVNPTPVIAGTANQTLCSNTATTAINFSSSVAGTTYNWTNINPAIGLGLSDSGNIGSFTAVNTTGLPESGVITVTPKAAYCIGAAETFTITVNPTPDVTIPANQVLCTGATTNVIDFTGSITTSVYSWTNSVPGIGLAASGTGNIVPFVVTNSSASTTETASITVTPKAYGCTGAPASFTITVYPNPVVPQITTEAPAALCSNTDFTNFGTSTPAPAGVTYTWSVVNATLWKVGAGNQYSLISFPNPGASQVTLTSSYGTTSCVNSATYNVTVGAGVSQNPVLTYYDGYFVCLDYNVDSYVWGYDDVVTLDSTLIPNVSTQNYYNPSPDFTNKYYWVITTKDGCMQKTYYSTPTPTNVANVTSDGVHMNLFPNPAESQLTITFTGATLAGTEARVFDMAGQQIATLPIVNNKAELTVDNIPSGVYSIGCYKDGVRISSATFVKQ